MTDPKHEDLVQTHEGIPEIPDSSGADVPDGPQPCWDDMTELDDPEEDTDVAD